MQVNTLEFLGETIAPGREASRPASANGASTRSNSILQTSRESDPGGTRGREVSATPVIRRVCCRSLVTGPRGRSRFHALPRCGTESRCRPQSCGPVPQELFRLPGFASGLPRPPARRRRRLDAGRWAGWSPLRGLGLPLRGYAPRHRGRDGCMRPRPENGKGQRCRTLLGLSRPAGVGGRWIGEVPSAFRALTLARSPARVRGRGDSRHPNCPPGQRRQWSGCGARGPGQSGR
jgi:hypothetical protein